MSPARSAPPCPQVGQPAPKPKRKGPSTKQLKKLRPKTRPKKPRVPKVCPDHGSQLVPRRTQYGTRWGCPVPLCTVVLWGGSTSTPANDETRAARMKAHSHFDQLWDASIRGSRSRAYAGLSAFMGIAPEACHIGMFNAEQCELVVEFCQIFQAEQAATTESNVTHGEEN